MEHSTVYPNTNSSHKTGIYARSRQYLHTSTHNASNTRVWTDLRKHLNNKLLSTQALVYLHDKYSADSGRTVAKDTRKKNSSRPREKRRKRRFDSMMGLWQRTRAGGRAFYQKNTYQCSFPIFDPRERRDSEIDRTETGAAPQKPYTFVTLCAQLTLPRSFPSWPLSRCPFFAGSRRFFFFAAPSRGEFMRSRMWHVKRGSELDEWSFDCGLNCAAGSGWFLEKKAIRG